VLRVQADAWSPLVRTVEVPEGEDVDLTVELSKGRRRRRGRGRRRRRTSRPRDGLRVRARTPADPGHYKPGYQSLVTDAAGKFRIEGLDAGAVDLGVSSQHHLLLRLQAHRGAVDRCAPRSRAQVTADRETRCAAAGRGDRRPGPRHRDGPRGQVRRTAGGALPHARRHAVGVDFVRPGLLEVIADVPGFAPAKITLNVPPGVTSSLDGASFAFEEGVALRGRVLTAEGAPVADASVTPFESKRRSASTDAEGRFVLPHLRPGPVELAVKSKGLAEVLLTTDTAAPDSIVDITLRPGGVLRGVVTERDGKPVGECQLCLFPATAADGYGPHWHAEVAKGGRYSIRLPGGPLPLRPQSTRVRARSGPVRRRRRRCDGARRPSTVATCQGVGGRRRSELRCVHADSAPAPPCRTVGCGVRRGGGVVRRGAARARETGSVASRERRRDTELGRHVAARATFAAQAR